jgi:PKHD-type hydroxylase
MSHCKITNNSTERDRIVHPFCFIKELFNKEEIGKIFEYTKTLETEDSYVGSGAGGEVNVGIRNSKTRFFMPNEESNWIFEKINNGVEHINDHFYNFDLYGYDSIQHTAYSGERSSFYNWHVDAFFGSIAEHHRKLSIVVMLSEQDKDFFGGDFQITQGDQDDPQTIKFQPGMMIAFPSYTMHRVTPVVKGMRQTLVTWVTGPKFR